jgi:hypothetical protein
MVQTPAQYAAVVAAVRDEAAELAMGLLAKAEASEGGGEEKNPPSSSSSPPAVVVLPGDLLSDEGSGEDD